MLYISDPYNYPTSIAFLQCSGGLKPRELQILKCLSFFIQSKHDTAEFHAAARAIGGCAAYVR